MTRFEDQTSEQRLHCLREIAQSALPRYDIGSAAPPVLINLSENATYQIDVPASGRRYALRVHRDGYHTRNGIASELAWMQALRREDVVTTPMPLPGKDGLLIQAVAHPAIARPRHVVLFAWESGSEPVAEERLADTFRVLGGLSARMHRHSRAWQRPANFERLVWDFDAAIGDRPLWGGWREGVGVDAEKAALFATAVALIGRRLQRFGQSPDRFGLTHSDLRLANLLVDGDQLKVLDFDDCGFGWYLYDAATAVSFFEHEPFVPELLAAWSDGYRRERDLAAEDEAELPTFVMLRRLLLVAWIGSHAETDLAQSLGRAYTEGTAALCDVYLSRFG
jgi:Ser/Thr protein kinase RdoA (MazF antagonist)